MPSEAFSQNNGAGFGGSVASADNEKLLFGVTIPRKSTSDYLTTELRQAPFSPSECLI